jgi:hypothetical protein
MPHGSTSSKSLHRALCSRDRLHAPALYARGLRRSRSLSRYLNRLYDRLNARSFLPDDRLYRAAFKAQTAMMELVMVLHYLTCDGVGEPGRSDG